MAVRPVRVSVAAFALIAACRGGGEGGRGAAPPAVRYGQHVFAGGAAPPGATLTNPYRADRRAAAQGEALFGAMNCDGCHGGGAAGWVGPNLADGRWRFGGSDCAIFQSIYYGRPHGMPAYGGLLLSADAVWKLVTYLESLTPPADVPTEAWDSTRP